MEYIWAMWGDRYKAASGCTVSSKSWTITPPGLRHSEIPHHRHDVRDPRTCAGSTLVDPDGRTNRHRESPLPLSGPFGFLTSPRVKLSAYQSATHFAALPAILHAIRAITGLATAYRHEPSLIRTASVVFVGA
jgi:hypothetical protein